MAHALLLVCLLVICFFNIIVSLDDICYIANVGDSRALMSLDGGNFIGLLSNDHKPNDDAEQKRITEAGGKIYQ